MTVSRHTARADNNHVLHGGLHRESFVPISAFMFPGLLSVPEIFRVDIGILGTYHLDVTFYLHIYRSEQSIILGTEFPLSVS